MYVVVNEIMVCKWNILEFLYLFWTLWVGVIFLVDSILKSDIVVTLISALCKKSFDDDPDVTEDEIEEELAIIRYNYITKSWGKISCQIFILCEGVWSWINFEIEEELAIIRCNLF